MTESQHLINNEGAAIVWLRNDLRLQDHAALTAAASQHPYLIPLYLWDPQPQSPWAPGAASRWWLHHALKQFSQTLQQEGSALVLLQGEPLAVFERLLQGNSITAVYWSESGHPDDEAASKALQALLLKKGVQGKAFAGSTLCPTSALLKDNGSPYQVFTAFWNNFLQKYQVKHSPKPRLPPLPPQLATWGLPSFDEELAACKLLPSLGWDSGFYQYWQPGEEHALKRLKVFLTTGILSYNSRRDQPQLPGTSCLSPHLHFGELHPQRILALITRHFGPLNQIRDTQVLQFCKEVVWREFSYHLLKHFPDTPTTPLKELFRDYPWETDQRLLAAWKKGQTGYPLVDAGMRQLWHSGWMHNRVRMVAASFLVKHLNIPWQEGAKWFWDTLVDADLANNTMGWQWVAGCGADAAPFFRIFNPSAQGEKFDPKGEYVARWCPELAALPAPWIYQPWKAPKQVLDRAGVRLGSNYPHPIVEHEQARKQALWHYERLRKARS